MFQPVHSEGALAQGGLCATAVCTMCGPGAQRDALGVGPAGHQLRLAVVEGVLGRPDDGDVDRLAVNGEQVGRRSFPGSVAGVGGACTPGMPTLAMPRGRASGPAE